MIFFSGLNPCKLLSCGPGEECRTSKQGISECACAESSCARVVRPVCASDRRTYVNECEMRRRACQTGADLTVRYVGTCGEAAAVFYQ